MSFYIPAETCKTVRTGGLPPGTGYYAVEITQFEDRGVLDRQGNYSYFIHLRFPDGGTTKEIGSLPFNSEGELAPALQAMDEQTRNKKIGGMVGALKRVALSTGITNEYMSENGLSTEHLVGRTGYIAWLGRPNDVPEGLRVYGELQDWLQKDRFDKLVAEGKQPVDNRQFHWRKGNNAPSNGAYGAKMPAPPATRGNDKLPPPPTR